MDSYGSVPPGDRAELVVAVYDRLVAETVTFDYEDLALVLAYLFPAILKGTTVEVYEGTYTHGLLLRCFNKEHQVWDFITVEEKEDGKGS